MRESDFQKEVKNSINEQGGWCKKFPDMPAFKVNLKEYDALVNKTEEELAL